MDKYFAGKLLSIYFIDKNNFEFRIGAEGTFFYLSARNNSFARSLHNGI